MQHRYHDSQEIDNHSTRKINLLKEYGNLPLVVCNPGELNQVFFNIISNAIDALENPMKRREKNQNSQILIKTKVTDNQSVKIKISDNGCGMTEEVRQRIFEPFFTTKVIGSGTGLGLSISYSIVVDNHKGQLNCISSPDGGTEFLIEIPIDYNTKM